MKIFKGVSVWCIAFVAILLLSCNAEKKALKPYNKVLTDIDTSFNKQKTNLLAKIVDAKMPNKAKKEVVTKYIQGKEIKVKDTAGVAKIAAYYESKLQGKVCFTGFELDSMINDAIDNIEPDKIYRTDTIDNSTVQTIIDTTGNYYKEQQRILLETNLNACSNDYHNEVFAHKVTNQKYEELQAKQTQLGYLASTLFKAFLKKYWWLLIILLGVYIGGRTIKNKWNLLTNFFKP